MSIYIYTYEKFYHTQRAAAAAAMVRATGIDGKGGAHWGHDGEEAGDGEEVGDGAGEAGDAARGDGEGAGDGARSDEEEAGDGARSDGEKACGGAGRRRQGAGDDGLGAATTTTNDLGASGANVSGWRNFHKC